MRIALLLAVAAAACLGGQATSAAAPNTIDPWHTSFGDDYYYRQGDDATDYAPMPRYLRGASYRRATPSSEPACGCEDACCGDACGCGSGCAAAPVGLFTGCSCLGCIEGFTLAGALGLDSPYEVGGWTEVFYEDNNVPLSQSYNDLLSFDDVPDHAQVGQQWFYIGRKANGDNGLGLGGRIDALYGTDAQKTQAFGNPGAGVRGFGFYDASWDHGEYGFAMPQLYGELAYGDASVKIGHFFTPVGYEVIPVVGNFFRTHSYTMFNSEPFTHTGALGTYSGFEGLTLYGGWSLGWDTGYDQLNSGNCLISGFGYNISDSVTFTYINTYGNFGWRDGGDDNSYEHSMVLTANLTQNLQYVAQSDMIDTSNPGVSDYDTFGINQYLFYTLTDVVKVGGRMEWWKADGVSYYEATGGFNVQLLSNCVLRPEMRQDWAPGIGLDEDTFAIDCYLTY
jgi:hypothetical protein